MESLCLRICMLLFLVQFSTGFSSLKNNNTSVNHDVCHEDERQLLLHLKQELSPFHPEKYYRTKYWKGSRDCCLWDGVRCDYFTGRVIALDLSHKYNDDRTNIYLNSDHNFSDDGTTTYLMGELKSNSSLFHLTHLRKLNLAFNNFTGSAIPSEFRRLNALTHLNLSRAEFGGDLPMEFYHLSNLFSLDLSAYGDFDIDEPVALNHIWCDANMLLGNMTRLRVLVLTNQHLASQMPMNMSSFLTHLDLGGTGVRGNLPATIFDKPNLQILRLYGNFNLKGSLPKSLNRSNALSITELDLSATSMSGTLPNSVGLMTNLYYMALSNCRFRGPIPESLGNITGIALLELSRNDFTGGIPSTFSNLGRLFYLDLSQNYLEGQLPDAVWGFQNLHYLSLRRNYIVGQIPLSLTNMSQLEWMDISSNAFAGPFPSTQGHGLQKLRYMYLSNNSIQGTIPPWLFTLPSLVVLDLSSNRLTGRIGKLNSQTLGSLDLSYNGFKIDLESFYNLTNIIHLVISHNTVREHDGNIVNVSFPNLLTLKMSSCEINEELLYNLLWRMPSLEYLDLSNNNIHGPIPNLFSSNPPKGLQLLDLSNNSLRGTFPSSICNMTELSIINLSDNKLSGNIPECLANSTTQLEVLDLRRNEFRGKIPTTIGSTTPYLSYIGLNGNHLEGPLPPSLANCTWLEVIDLGNNMLQDTFPWWLHTLPHLRILILKSNSFHGSITSPAFTDNSFTDLQILDLSYNNFTGLLPENLFASLEAIKYPIQYSQTDGLYMRAYLYDTYEYSVTLSVKGADVEFNKVFQIFTTIDLSSNNFNGSIPVSLSNMTSLRLLNLSHNNIHGSIPPALGRMTNLEQLDLSSNQLTGCIPQSLTNLTFLEVLGLSHNHLVGPIPQGNQFPTFSNESYAGNPGLCGLPLTRSCGNEKEPPSSGEDEEEDEDDGFMMGFTWKTVVVGYGCGILFGFILGNILISIEKPRWLARFVHVEAAIILSKRKKRRRVVQGRR